MYYNPLVVIVGPTASGKSALAMKIAQKYNGEIICADSRTVYKEMNIGTAKPTIQEQRQVPHHLLDVVFPNEAFTAAEFKMLAIKAIDNISKKGKVPILVGGTGLYIDAVLFSFNFGPKADERFREELSNKSTAALLEICRQKNIDISEVKANRRHLIRAIELNGVKNSDHILRPNTVVVGLTIDRQQLLSRIARRISVMLQSGLLEEVKALDKKYGWTSEAMTSNIYRVFKDVVNGKKTVQQGIQEAILRDFQLAKRQMTWFKRNQYILWLSEKEASQKIEHFLSHKT